MKGPPGTEAPEHQYAVVTADLVMSRGLADRRGTQRRLVQLVDTLNTEFGKDLAAPFMITLGDEIQGLLREPVRFPPVISTIHTAFRPDAITVGVGLGGVATELTTRVTEMDGPVFVSARRAVETGKSKKLEVVVVSGSDQVDAVLNTIYGFIGGVQSRWKLKQWERVNLYRKHRSLEKVAREAGVTKQAISLDLRFTLWDRVLVAEAQLPEIVAFLLGGTPGSSGNPLV